jgi:hypothetical protein
MLCMQAAPTHRLCLGEDVWRARFAACCLLLDHLLPVCGVLHACVDGWLTVVGHYMKKLSGRLTPAPMTLW